MEALERQLAVQLFSKVIIKDMQGKGIIAGKQKQPPSSDKTTIATAQRWPWSYKKIGGDVKINVAFEPRGGQPGRNDILTYRRARDNDF
ncbi:hypothetical protein FACS1894159_01170 [Bacteroidia bacterium]|nr:hypothetical protein FACS1894159_01170 [Bacteroidia bacterium]